MKYPEMRNELLEYLYGLGNFSYQKECWINDNCPNGVEHDNFDLAVHFLFDDTTLSTDPEGLIGYFLKSKKEAKAIKKLCDKIEVIFQKYGLELSDAQYIELPEWLAVIDLATKALHCCKEES